MRFVIFFAVWAALVAATVNSEGHYSIIAPGTLHPDHIYTVAVGIHDTTEPCEIKVGITGADYNDIKTVNLKPNEITTLDFEVPKSALEEPSYNLTAEGVSGLVFKNTTKLDYKIFDPYIKIQTDKGKYKPGDTVNFRVLFLDENLKPAQVSKDAYIWIEDAKRNRIKEYKHLNTVKGVYTDQFQVSEFATLGSWRIEARNNDKNYATSEYFTVEKYVLPKFSVKVEATEDVSVKDGDMQVLVRANYTYGKPVNAKVTLLIDVDNSYAFGDQPEAERKPAPITIKKTDMVNGKAKFDLNIRDYADYMPKNDTSYSAHITTTVEENFTGVMINGTKYSTFYPYRYKVHCAEWSFCSQFDADKEFEIPIKITHVDNSKVDDRKSVVRLYFIEELKKNTWYRPSTSEDNTEITTTTLTPPVSEGKEFQFDGHLNETGIAPIKVKLDSLKEYEGYRHYYTMKVEFIDEIHNLFSTFQHREPKNVEPMDPIKEPTDWFDLDTIYKKDKWSAEIGEQVIVSMNCSEPMKYFLYHIIGRGNVLHTERVDLAEPTKLHNLTITTTFMMVPHSSIYVYFINETGDFRYAETSLAVELTLQNTIDLTAPEEVKPGEEVALKIKTPVHSFVGLLAVDQSVLLLGNNNDINGDDFRWRLGGYNTHTPRQGGYSYYPGQQSGVVTLTNSDYFYNWTKPEWHGHITLRSYASRPRGPDMVQSAESAAADDSISESLSGGGAGGAMGPGQMAGFDASNIRVRKNFEETWIFANIEDTQTEEFTWKKQIPDTITSWVVSAFSLNEEKGLGVTKDQKKIRTFQPFFISLRLPYAVKRGEVINVPALVSNYLEKDLDVEITLENTDNEYEFIEASNEVINEPKRVKSVRVPSNSASGVSFMIRPKIIGNIMLKFTAISPIAGDSIHKTLKVVPEGTTEYANRAYFVNLKDETEFKKTFELDLPKDIVVDSQHIEFGVVGDLLGPVLKNLENMLRMPLGCGEQVTSTMVPNYLVLQYLNKTHQLTDVLERKIKRNLEQGYQSILSYRNDDGSFSSFGWLRHHEKRNGSTWLTAYVTRTLQKISPIISIDQKVIKAGLDYIAKQQAENGSFTEAGDYFYASQNQHLTRTASVVLTFVEDPETSQIYKNTVEKALKYINDELEKSDDIQTQALGTYALHVAKHASVPAKITSLKAKAKSDEDRTWWSNKDTKKSDWWRWTYSNEVETTSYILLVLLDLETENTQSVLPIIRWLVAQRNNQGGFSSTHDTVVGLQALIKFAEKSGYEPALMDVDFEAKGSEKKGTIKTTNENALLLQTVELPQKTTGVDFHAKGKGFALIQVAYQYNILEKETTPSFMLDIIVNPNAPEHKLDLEVCVEYTGEGEASNMAVVEISLPSGYVADSENFEEIEKVKGVRLTETKEKETVVVVYFDSLHKTDKKCLPVVGYKQFPVAMQKPVPVVAYDYYDTSKRDTKFYKVASKLCQICEDDEECKNICK